MINIIDHGLSNSVSVLNMLRRLGIKCDLVEKPQKKLREKNIFSQELVHLMKVLKA